MSSNQRWVLGLTAAASLMVALDALVVSTALSTMRLDLRELGGVLGSAVLASVFARQGVYHSPRVFIDGFAQALWVGVRVLRSRLRSGAPRADPRTNRTSERRVCGGRCRRSIPCLTGKQTS